MRPGVCKHCKGTRDQFCGAGIDVRALVGGDNFGWVLRRPCHRLDLDRRPIATEIICDKYEEPTAEEIEQDAKEVQEAQDRLLQLLPLLSLIRKEHHKHDWQGTAPCPNCNGTLTLTHYAYNGHIHGRCSTPNCTVWSQ